MMDLNETLKILSSPMRRMVLTWLKDPQASFQGYSQIYDFSVYGVCASHIQDKAGLSQPATSLCLKALSDHGLVVATKVGKWTYYKRQEQQLAATLTDLLHELEVDAGLLQMISPTSDTVA
ncbi:ArsR/SmtB family transcription factor [Pseudomonas sp. MWU13-2105]|uniref:ArsR/SmtB family transcription factor n=1 Tax=Pseudomonas sp. MWU13-2105 TaxID=2935074 RepID=UPI00200CDFC2|nr:helix-turn-helix transcriptional regulator [Pseudomonas sp. MWU13-2105]